MGPDMMIPRFIRKSKQEKQLVAKPQPINVAAWDAAIISELGHTNNEGRPTIPHTRGDAMDMDL